MSKYKVELNKRCVERYVREIILESSFGNESKNHTKKKFKEFEMGIADLEPSCLTRNEGLLLA